MSKLGKTSGVFLLLGPEEGDKAEYIRKLIQNVHKAGDDKPEVVKFYPYDLNIVDVIVYLRNGSLFSQYRVGILSTVEELTRKSDVQALVEYAQNPAANTTLLLLSDTIREVDKRIKAAVKKENTIIFWEMFENQKVGWVTNFFRKNGITIASAACQFLLEMIENNTQELRSVCGRLVHFFGKDSVIDIEDVEKYVYHSKEENVFSLFEKIAQRDFKAAVEILNTILLSGEAEPIRLLSGILWQLRKLDSFKRLHGDNYQVEEVFKRIGIMGKGNQKIYLTAHRQYERDEVEAIHSLLYEFDKRIRFAKSDLQKYLLELFLYYCIVRGGRGYWSLVGERFPSAE